MPPRLFLLSPSRCTGVRARMLLSPRAQVPLAQQVRSAAGAPLGDVFSFLSGLYFRGKLAYALTFANSARLSVSPGLKPRPTTPRKAAGAQDRAGRPRPTTSRSAAGEQDRVGRGFSPGDKRSASFFPVLVITPSLGLQPPDYPVTLELLEQFAQVQIDTANRTYTEPLEASAAALNDAAGPHAQAVLLGSIATGKYVDILARIFGDRLVFPAEFVGRGDMSRGGLLLRCVTAGMELTYVPVQGAVRHGTRPPKLEPLRRRE